MDPNNDFIPGNVTTFTDFLGLVDFLRRCVPLFSLFVMLWSMSTALRVAQFRQRLFSVAQRVTPNLFVDKVDR